MLGTLWKPLQGPLRSGNVCNIITILNFLFFSGTESRNEVMGTFPSYNAEATAAQYARVSKISEDSFDSSSTSSGECYENTNGYVMVTPGQSNPFACFPLSSTFERAGPTDSPYTLGYMPS